MSFYSIDDHIRYDLPGAIDFVLDVRQRKDLHIVGFSMGTTVSFGLLSSQPEYNAKVRMIIALVPATYFKPAASLRAILAILGYMSQVWISLLF